MRYDDVARALVLAFKFSDRLDLAPMMGRWMARAGRELLADAGGLLPVPLHWRRLWARRLNLAAAISEVSGAPVMHGAFQVLAERKGQIAGKKLVLIDDVLTSGATVDTCARALLWAGAARVDVPVFAWVVAPLRNTI